MQMKQEPLSFGVGARVRLSTYGRMYYGAAGGSFVPQSQGGPSGIGTILVVDRNRPHDPRADARPYYLCWDNGSLNSYREVDLVSAHIPHFEIVGGE